ncbi:hypothetical protein ACFOSC_14410 [Streptantibioticus rubrisoli]|uniref:Uncharacterized protein n=1 Tax=Streptantibioticus rubrisoli TaxID=1387313 RepID=A0ABT1P9W2_9ACTN|nr:hypothetical protein [Streptantibioticus rubrisoli]MCQ4042161.1 hypothetical protein [Streptantibioticus rubrisoli]
MSIQFLSTSQGNVLLGCVLLGCAVAAVIFGGADALAGCDIAPTEASSKGVTMTATTVRRRWVERLGPTEIDMTWPLREEAFRSGR